MTQFGKVIGGGGGFRTALVNKLKDFQHGHDYTIFHEVFGNLRREHWVILSERSVNALREVDWHGLADFKSIEVGSTDNSEVENNIENELLKLIVETEGNEWVSDYQTTNPTKFPEEIRRQKVEIMLEQIKIEAKKSGESLPSISHLKARLRWSETKDINYSQLKSLIKDSSRSHLEHLKPVSPSDPDAIYHYSETFEDGKRTVEERGSRPLSGQITSGSSNSEKHCPNNCKVRDFSLDDKFCRSCGCLMVVVESQIREITDQEAQQIQNSSFFPKPRGNF